jgi:Leucine-rich repeat (LRR) protein
MDDFFPFQSFETISAAIKTGLVALDASKENWNLRKSGCKMKWFVLLNLLLSPVLSFNSDYSGIGEGAWSLATVATRNGTRGLILQSNNFTSVSFPADPYENSAVETLRLDDHLLTEFPNLECFKDRLLNLFLSHNLINHVSADYLDVLTKLQKLDLGFNQLSQFPDTAGPPLQVLVLRDNNFVHLPTLPMVGQHLNQVLFGGNDITDLSADFFAFYPAATVFGIRGSNLRTLPKLCDVPWVTGSSVTITTTSLNLVCDHHLRWLFLGFKQATLNLDGPPAGFCRFPDALMKVALNTLSVADFYPPDDCKYCQHGYFLKQEDLITLPCL